MVSINYNSTKQLGYVKWKLYLGTLVLCLRGRCGYATIRWTDLHCLTAAASLWPFITDKCGNCPLAACTMLWVPSICRSHCTLSEAEERAVLPTTALVKFPQSPEQFLLSLTSPSAHWGSAARSGPSGAMWHISESKWFSTNPPLTKLCERTVAVTETYIEYWFRESTYLILV